MTQYSQHGAHMARDAVTKFAQLTLMAHGDSDCTSTLLRKMLAVCCLLAVVAPRVLASHILIKVS